jgi:large subunit ribosomal protein L9
MIDVILLEKVGRLGQIGQKVKVKPGFARNYLLPQKKALRATKENLAYFESKRSEIEAANAKGREAAELAGKKLDGKVFTLIRQASDVGQLFGSVTVRDIAEQMKTGGFATERQNVLLPAPIKTLGMHNIDVRLHPEVSVKIKLNIARTEDEAKTQEKTGQIAKAKALSEAEAAVKAAAEVEANKAFFEAPAAEEGSSEEEKA